MRARQIIESLIPSRLTEGDDDYPYAAADFHERVDDQMADMVLEFKAKTGRGRISWPRIASEPLTKIWLVYGKRGTIFDEDGLDKIADQAMNLIARLWAYTQISGHDSVDVRPDVEDVYGRSLSDEEWEKFQSMLEDEKGNYLVSDFAFRWLKPLYDSLYNAKAPEEKLLVLDKIFNVIHQRSDLAGIFVQGGSATLRKIAEQGGYTVPDEQHPQMQAMNKRSFA